MKPEEITFTGSDGATTLYASVWEPEGECRGTVQICHGMSEHIGRYHWLAEQLTARGYRVCGDDHLGHGRTAQRKEDLGYFGAKDGWKHLIEDEHLLFGIMRQRAPEQPYFLLGHSMGSFITRAYITRFGEGLSGYICCGTSGRNPLVKPRGSWRPSSRCFPVRKRRASSLTGWRLRTITAAMKTRLPVTNGFRGIRRCMRSSPVIRNRDLYLKTRVSAICSICLTV